MAYPAAPTRTLPVSPVPAESPATPPFVQVIEPYPCITATSVAGAQINQEPSEQKSRIGVRGRMAAAACAVYFVLTEGQAAEAAPSYMIAHAESPGSGINWIALITGATAVIGAITGVTALRRQTRERRHDRFIDALRDVAGTSDAAQLQTRINILSIYVEGSFQPEVFITAVQYLRARRATVEELRDGLEDKDPKERLGLLDRALTKRRNADRAMLRLFTQTYPEVLAQAQEATTPSTKRGIIGYSIGRIAGRVTRRPPREDKLQALRKVTGFLSTRNKQLIDAAGINLDLMRDTVADCDLSRVDLTGAGLQGNNFENVVFEGCDFGEAQLEGTTMVGCDLSGANFQAAYFSGDPKDPYFMGITKFENCIVDKNTRFGHRPDNHPKAYHYSNDPDRPQAYRGGGTVILRNLRSHQRADGTPVLSDDEIIAMVQEWQDNGLELDPRSDPQYLKSPS